MNDFERLLFIIDEKVKNNIKEGDYLDLMNTISKIYRDKLDKQNKLFSDDDECDNEYGGQYC